MSGSGAQTVAVVQLDGSLKIADPTACYIQRISYDGSLPKYIGFSEPGEGTGSATWQIKKLTYDGTSVTEINFANGDLKFDKVWDWRTGSYTYC